MTPESESYQISPDVGLVITPGFISESELRRNILPNTVLKTSGLLLLLLFAVTTVLFTSHGDQLTIVESKGSDDYTPRGIVTSASIKFNLVRVGYDPLPYFSSGTSVIDSIVQYKIFDGFDTVIEPNVDMQFAYRDDDERDSSAAYVKYALYAVDDDDDFYSGLYSVEIDDVTNINVNCSPHAQYFISMNEYDASNEILRSSVGKGLCMYVRREIQGLSVDDLQSAMDAMYVLWSTSEEDGQELYGENFHSASYFAAAHDFNAAQMDSDHIHEGLGFVPQHIKLTNMFEQAVQAVDPSFALPYWDFTIDVARNLTIYESFMFTENTFGTLTKPKSSYWGFTYTDDSLDSTAVQDGRWKNLEAEVNTRFADMGNAFGYMRGPWNMNPSPYLTRFSAYSPSLPTCSEYYGGLGMRDFMDSLANARNGPHASTHGVIGSVFGCDKLDQFRESGIIKDADSQLSICKKWGFYMKVCRIN